MKLIKPSQISGEIFTIIQEADQFVTIISPYYKVEKWYKLKRILEELNKKNIPVTFYVRKGESESIEQVNSINCTPIEISNLHCKIYMNEKTAVVSSMNLILSSEINSLDIAYKTETEEEYNELREFVERYISSESIQPDKKEEIPDLSLELIKDNMFKQLLNIGYVRELDGLIILNTDRNRYEALIEYNENQKLNLSMNAILTTKEFEKAIKSKQRSFNHIRSNVELVKGENREYCKAIGNVIHPFKSSCINNPQTKEDADKIVLLFEDFILGIEKFKAEFI